MIHDIQKLVMTCVHDQYDIAVKPNISRPDKQFGDYSTNVALQIAKTLHANPRDLAAELADRISASDLIASAEVAGPGFINVRISAAGLFRSLDRAARQARSETMQYGENIDGQGKTVVVEYPSPNMAKPFSVGHMRPSNQGWAMKRLMEVTGWKVITDNHLGDYGTPFGKWVVGFLRYSSEEQLEQGGIHELARVYILINNDAKAEEAEGKSELAHEFQMWLLKLEQMDAEASRYSQRFNQLSLDHMHHIMRRLEISTEHELGEAFFALEGKAEVQRLIDAGVASRNEDGSVIVNLQDEGFDVPMLIQKSNGAALYATTDIATIRYREANWHPDKVLYAVDSGQQFHFRQLFALAKKLGITTDLRHIDFGVIDQINDEGKRERMSSRKGVVLMESLLDEAENRARAMVKGDDLDEDDIRAIALGTIKFADLGQDRRSGMLFDWDSMFSLTGYSGPFVQYAAVRVNSILAKQDHVIEAPAEYDWEAERELLLHLIDYPEVVREAANLHEAHRVATYVYELARILNRYYESTQVLVDDAQQRQARLYLLQQVAEVFEHGLSILGIRIPKRM